MELARDGAGSLVQALAARDQRGEAQVLVWNGTLDQSKRHGDPALSRLVRVRVTGLTAARYRLSHHRADGELSNVVRTWHDLGAPDWPDGAGWAALRAADRLAELEPSRFVTPEHGAVDLEFELPMPGASLLMLRVA